MLMAQDGVATPLVITQLDTSHGPVILVLVTVDPVILTPSNRPPVQVEDRRLLPLSWQPVSVESTHVDLESRVLPVLVHTAETERELLVRLSMFKTYSYPKM